jgi:hypothetical protein
VKIGLVYGAFASKIQIQLRRLGYRLKQGEASASQRDADAILRLYLRGVLTEAETKKARQRLNKAIVTNIVPIGKGDVDAARSEIR